MVYPQRNGEEGPRSFFSIPHEEELYYDEDTLFKVLYALVRAGLSMDQANAAIDRINEDGVLFRERKHL
jgi:hypothetical protein